MINNQEGQMSLYALPLILLISTLFLYGVYRRVSLFSHSKDQARLYLCVKKFSGELKKGVRYLALGNKTLASFRVSELALIPLLPESLPGIIKIRKLRKILIKAQDIFHATLLTRLNFIALKECKMTLPFTSLVYSTKGLSLKRDPLSFLALKKDQPWTIYFCKGLSLIRLTMKLERSMDQNIKFYSQEIEIPKLVSKSLNLVSGCSF